MAEGESKSYGVQITVAVIGLVGVIATALFSNWDKLFPAHGAPTPAPSPVAGASPAPGPVDAAGKLSDSQRNAYDAASGALDDVTRKIAAANPADLSGDWRDTDGYLYRISQSGADYRFDQYQGAVRVGGGSGRVEGARIRHSFVNLEAAGECTGEIASGSDAISGECTSGGERWAFRVTR